jgi:hypothetical protein
MFTYLYQLRPYVYSIIQFESVTVKSTCSITIINHLGHFMNTKLKALALPLLLSSTMAVAQNPLFTDVFTADPAALVPFLQPIW